VANECEWYPCHHKPCEGFSCEFCYCPLYEIECKYYGGNPKFINTSREVIKDCTDCMLPHLPDFKE
jgi:Zn-finger protein